jgi:hypothetical protein
MATRSEIKRARFRRASSARHSAERALWLRWVAAMTAGELVGFSAPAAIGATGYALSAPGALTLVPMVAAGAVEGAVLAFAQSLVLRRELPGFRTRDWVVATALAAAYAWAIGMTPSALGGFAEDHPELMIAGAAVLGPVLLNSVGVAQWWVLRRHVHHAQWWIVANAGGWLVGISAVFGAMALVQEGDPTWRIALAGILGGICMGAIVAFVTGYALVRLTRDKRPMAFK